MGFRLEPTIYNLSFAGTPLDGLHVRMSCCTLKEYNNMLRASMMEGEVSVELLEKNEEILDLFVNHLVSWDLEDMAGRPVPVTRDGIDEQERTVIAQLIQAWQIAMVNIPNPLSSQSSNGETSAEQSLGLGSASENLGN